MKYLIFAMVIAFVQSNTIGRGWESQPPAQSTDIVVDGNVFIDASGSSTSYTAADAIVVGDAAQPATLFLATGDSAQVFEDGEVSQIEIGDPTNGDAYFSNIVTGQDAAIGSQNTLFWGSGTGVAVSNTGDTDSYGTGYIGGSGGPIVGVVRPPISTPILTPETTPEEKPGSSPAGTHETPVVTPDVHQMH